MTRNLPWTEEQVLGKLAIYSAQMREPSANGRCQELSALAGDLIQQYASKYPEVEAYRPRLGC